MIKTENPGTGEKTVPGFFYDKFRLKCLLPLRAFMPFLRFKALYYQLPYRLIHIFKTSLQSCYCGKYVFKMCYLCVPQECPHGCACPKQTKEPWEKLSQS
jgi:hypothetical protein